MTHVPPPQQARPSRRRTWLRRVGAAAGLVLVVALLWAIEAGSPKSSPPSGVDGLSVPWSSPEENRFVADVDHPWLPLKRGGRWEFAVQSGDEVHVLKVADAPREVAGIATTVVSHDAGAGEAGFVADVAQDVDGNVWLIALAVAGNDDASWSVADGAPAGLVLPADPRRGDGHAVAAPDGAVTVRSSVEGHEENRMAIELSTVPQSVDEYTQRWDVVLERGVGPVAFSSYATGTATLIDPAA